MFGYWYQKYIDDALPPLDKARETLKKTRMVDTASFQQAVDELIFLVGSHALPENQKDCELRRRGSIRKFEPYYPNLDIAEAYYHLGRIEQAKDFLARSLERKGIKQALEQKVAAETQFIQETEKTLNEILSFLQTSQKKSRRDYQTQIMNLTELIEELEKKDYDTTFWMDPAKDYKRRLREVSEVFQQPKGRPPKKQGMKWMPQPPRLALQAEETDADADMLLALADMNSKAFKKSQDKQKKGEDALAKGDIQEAVDMFSDALDFLEAAGGTTEEMAPIQKLKDEAQQKLGGGAPNAASDATVQAGNKTEEAKKLMGNKNPDAKDLKKAKDLLVDARNLLDAAEAPGEKKAPITALLDDLAITIKDFVADHMKKLKTLETSATAEDSHLDGQIKLLKDIQLLEPDNQEVKVIIDKKSDQIDNEINRLYRLGMNAYSGENLDGAIRIWKKAVDLRNAAQLPPHKRLNADLAKAEQQQKTIKGG